MKEKITLYSLFSDLNERISHLKKGCPRVARSRKSVEAALKSGKTHYGINTGFGTLVSKKIPKKDLKSLQQNLLLSHAAGVGAPIPKEISKLMLQLKIHSLALGYSGISEGVFERLVEFAERDLIPAVPAKGSLGASGDLAPLAHMSLPLTGEGVFWNREGTKTLKALKILKEAGLKPLELKPKDGLALCNGTQMISAYGAFVLFYAVKLLKSADVIAAMSLDSLRGSIAPFKKQIHDLRPHRGQGVCAENIRKLLEESEIVKSHAGCSRVQDAYSLRCIPQVHGACRDGLGYAASVIETEINSVTDNPLVFENGEIISGGNFHGEPLALALDFAAIALSELAGISERRTYLLLSGSEGLPPFLVETPGVNSGFMVPQYTAAALVSENKILCHPASVDSIPSSLGQEDFVSMGAAAALKLYEVFINTENVLAIEALTAAQALEFRRPLKSGAGVEAAHEALRKEVPFRKRDAIFSDDIEKSRLLLRKQVLLSAAQKQTGELA